LLDLTVVGAIDGGHPQAVEIVVADRRRGGIGLAILVGVLGKELVVEVLVGRAGGKCGEQRNQTGTREK